MKRLNVRLVLIVGITFVVLAAGVVVVHGIQMSRNADSLIKRAETAKDSDDLNQALRLYQRYLTYRPDDIAQYAAFAELITQKAKQEGGYNRRTYEMAVGALEHVVRYDKSQTELRLKLVDLHMMVRQFPLAKEHLMEMKSLGDTNPQVDIRLAKCVTTKGDYLEAMKLLEDLIGFDPQTGKFDQSKDGVTKELEAYTMLAEILRDRVSDVVLPDRKELADRVIEQMVAANSDSAEAYLAQADYLKGIGQGDKANQAIDRAMKLAPEDALTILRAAEVAMANKDTARARELLAKGVKLHPKDDRMHRGMAILAAIENKPSEIKQRLEEGLKLLPTSAALLEMQFNMQLQERDLKDASVTLKKLEAAGYRSVLLQILEARLKIAEGDMLAASRQLEGVRAQVSGAPVYLRQCDLLLLDCYESLNQPDLLYSTAQSLLLGEPRLMVARVAKAAALAMKGQNDEALTEYELILETLKEEKKLIGSTHVWSAVLRLRIAEQMRQPLEKRDWTGVASLISTLREQGLPEPASSLLEADLMMNKGQRDRTRQILQDLRKKFPNDPSVINAQVNFALQERDGDEALQLMDSLPAALKNRLNLLPARIEALVVRGGTIEEIKQRLAESVKELDSMPEPVRLRTHAALASAYLKLGEPKLAQEQYKKMVALRPDGIGIRWMLFDASREIGDVQAIEELAQWFENEFGRDSGQAKLVRAAQYLVMVKDAQRVKMGANQREMDLDDVDRANLKKARELLREIEQMRPNWDDPHKLLAEINSMEGNIDDAIENYQDALRMGPPNTQLVKQLVQLLFLRHRMQDAQEVLDKYGSQTGKGLERIEAAVNLSSGRSEEALRKIEASVPKDSKDPQDHLFYGQMLAQIGKGAEAEDAFRRAVKLAPDLGQAWLMLVSVLVANGKPAEAHKVIQEAQIALPEDQRAIVLAQGYEALGDRTLADQYYQAVLNANPKDLSIQRMLAMYNLRTNRLEEAKKYLNEILENGPSNPAERENLAWAKRTTAQILAGNENHQQFRKAMELLTPPKGEKASAQDLAVKIALLAARSDWPSAREALALTEELKRLRELTPDEQLMLAKLYDYLGDWTQARDEVLGLLSQPNPTPEAYATYIEMLLRRGLVDDAGPWVRALEESAPNSMLLMPLKVKVMSRLGRGQQASAELLRRIPTRPLSAELRPHLLATAQLLEQIDQFEEAEKLYREYVGYDPSKAMTLAAFLARRGRLDEALDLAEKNQDPQSPLSLLKFASMALAQVGPLATAKQIERVERWFEHALKDNPDSIPVRIQLGELRDLQGRYAEAEELYRTAYNQSKERSRERAIMANNLAFCLAMEGKDLDEALKLAEEAVDYFGPNSDVLDTRGVVYLEMRDVQQARRDLTEAVANPSAQGVKYVHLAMAQAAAGDDTAARKSLEKAKDLKFKPDNLPPKQKEQFDALIKRLYGSA